MVHYKKAAHGIALVIFNGKFKMYVVKLYQVITTDFCYSSKQKLLQVNVQLNKNWWDIGKNVESQQNLVG